MVQGIQADGTGFRDLQELVGEFRGSEWGSEVNEEVNLVVHGNLRDLGVLKDWGGDFL